jgi:recombination protein RecT
MENIDNRVKTIRDLLGRSKSQFALAVPKHLNPERLLRVGMTAIQRTPKLMQCEPMSLVGALMQCAQLGLEPDGILGHAYLVPFKNKKTGKLEAQFMVGYKGLISLARRSGEVQSINAQVVYENDHFEYCYGLNDKLEHKPARIDRGNPIAAYCVAKFKDGGHAFEVMSVEDIEEVRSQSKAKDDGPWVTHWGEMAKKTVTRKLAKYIPLSVEFQRAAALDEYADAGIFPSSGGNIELPEAQIDEEALKEFEEKIPASTDKNLLNEFIEEVAGGNECTVDQCKADASKDMGNFLKLFEKWCEKKNGKATEDPRPDKQKEKAEAKEEQKNEYPTETEYQKLLVKERKTIAREIYDALSEELQERVDKIDPIEFEDMNGHELNQLYPVLKGLVT